MGNADRDGISRSSMRDCEVAPMMPVIKWAILLSGTRLFHFSYSILKEDRKIPVIDNCLGCYLPPGQALHCWENSNQ